jgi:exopolysaccharide biosynthesis operon protein EpsL
MGYIDAVMALLVRHFARVMRHAAAAVLLAIAAPSQALQGDRVRPSVGVVANYYSNLFYLDDRIPSAAIPFLKNGQKSDWSRGLRVGLDADLTASRQTFLLRSSVSQNNFSTYSTLDNTAYDVRGTWNWVAGSRWDGDAAATFSESLGSFIDTRGSQKNIRKVNTYSASAMYRVLYDWKLRAALGYYELQNSDPLFLSANRRETSYELGSRYYSKDEDNFVGLNFRAIDGVFPNRQQFLVSTANDTFRQFTAEGVVNWRYSQLTSLEGAIGWTNRLHDQISIRNFSGLTGRLVWNYGLTGATSMNTTVFREISTPETVGANYALTQGVRAGPVWRYSEKLSFQATAGFSNRRFLGDPLTANTGTIRVDDLWTASGSVLWTPSRRTQVDATVSYDKRTSNAVLFDFTGVSVFLAARYNF